MTYREMNEAVSDAEQTLRIADAAVEKIVGLIAGRLRKSGDSFAARSALVKLKRELRDFDMRKRTWSDER